MHTTVYIHYKLWCTPSCTIWCTLVCTIRYTPSCTIWCNTPSCTIWCTIRCTRPDIHTRMYTSRVRSWCTLLDVHFSVYTLWCMLSCTRSTVCYYIRFKNKWIGFRVYTKFTLMCMFLCTLGIRSVVH